MEGGEWSSFNGVYVNEEADFMAQLFPTNFPMATSDEVIGCSSMPHWSYNTKGFPGDHSYLCDNHFLVDNNISLFGSLDEKLGEFGEVEHADNNQFLPKRGSEMSSELEGSDISRKHARISNVQKGKNATRSKKRQKGCLADEDNNAGLTKQTIGDCSSEDESNLSLELSNGASSSGKPRASKGSATDPQSLYARKRRERINERLKVLQSLVPNGTKVDISTMLEEAVQYVKFLQLQIKLLSSDDMWMYAPIAYNGMDIGLNHKILHNKLMKID